MNAAVVRVRGTDLASFDLGGDSAAGAVELIWAHGWGHTHHNLLPLARAVRRAGHSVLIDLPGFGVSPIPPDAWGTADYADAIAEFLAGNARPAPPPPAGEERRAATPKRRIWIAHSFGCRVGLQLAARHPDLLDGLFLIAAAGLPPRRSPWRRARITARRWTYNLARRLAPEGSARDRLRARFGSADYRDAGALRPILVKAVNEDLSAAAGGVRVPTVLVYGDRDRETPAEIGVRLNRIIPQSRLVVLRGFDHWTVLTDGQHQIAQLLSEFVGQIG